MGNSKSSRLSYILVETIKLEIDKCKSKNVASVSEVLVLLSWSSVGYIWLILWSFCLLHWWKKRTMTSLIKDTADDKSQQEYKFGPPWAPQLNRGSYLSAYVLLNLLNVFRLRDKMRGLLCLVWKCQDFVIFYAMLKWRSLRYALI